MSVDEERTLTPVEGELRALLKALIPTEEEIRSLRLLCEVTLERVGAGDHVRLVEIAKVLRRHADRIAAAGDPVIYTHNAARRISAAPGGA